MSWCPDFEFRGTLGGRDQADRAAGCRISPIPHTCTRTLRTLAHTHTPHAHCNTRRAHTPPTCTCSCRGPLRATACEPAAGGSGAVAVADGAREVDGRDHSGKAGGRAASHAPRRPAASSLSHHPHFLPPFATTPAPTHLARIAHSRRTWVHVQNTISTARVMPEKCAHPHLMLHKIGRVPWERCALCVRGGL